MGFHLDAALEFIIQRTYIYTHTPHQQQQSKQINKSNLIFPRLGRALTVIISFPASTARFCFRIFLLGQCRLFWKVTRYRWNC